MTAATGSAGQPRVQLFSRASSGLIRELSFSDTVWYGVFSGGALFGFVYLFPTPQYVSQGISIPLMLVFTLLYGVVIYFVYAALGSAMPRAGGDYLYETRSLHPLVGFTVPWACQLLFWLTFPPGRGIRAQHLRPGADRAGVQRPGRGLLAGERERRLYRLGRHRRRVLGADRRGPAHLPADPAVCAGAGAVDLDPDHHRPAPRQSRHQFQPRLRPVPEPRPDHRAGGGRGGQGRLSPGRASASATRSSGSPSWRPTFRIRCTRRRACSARSRVRAA